LLIDSVFYASSLPANAWVPKLPADDRPLPFLAMGNSVSRIFFFFPSDCSFERCYPRVALRFPFLASPRASFRPRASLHDSHTSPTFHRQRLPSQAVSTFFDVRRWRHPLRSAFSPSPTVAFSLTRPSFPNDRGRDQKLPVAHASRSSSSRSLLLKASLCAAW